MAANSKTLKSFSAKGMWDKFVNDVFRYPLYVMTNPFKAYSDIKYEHKGSLGACIFFMFMLCITKIANAAMSGWIVNTNDLTKLNIWASIAGVLISSLIFAVANWAIGILIDGSGKFKYIFMVTMYCQYPSIWLTWAYILLSNVLTLNEMAFATFCTALGLVCTVLYGFIGLVSVHEFGFGKGIASIILTVVAIMIIVFVALLIATMAGELVTFVSVIAKEIVLNYF